MIVIMVVFLRQKNSHNIFLQFVVFMGVSIMISFCFSFNKKRFKYAALTGFFLLLILGGIAANNRMNKTVSNLNVAFEKTVVLDAGHGGLTNTID